MLIINFNKPLCRLWMTTRRTWSFIKKLLSTTGASGIRPWSSWMRSKSHFKILLKILEVEIRGIVSSVHLLSHLSNDIQKMRRATVFRKKKKIQKINDCSFFQMEFVSGRKRSRFAPPSSESSTPSNRGKSSGDQEPQLETSLRCHRWE